MKEEEHNKHNKHEEHDKHNKHKTEHNEHKEHKEHKENNKHNHLRHQYTDRHAYIKISLRPGMLVVRHDMEVYRVATSCLPKLRPVKVFMTC